MYRAVGDLILQRAQRLETERKLEQRQKEEEDFLLEQQRLHQRALQQMQREKKLQEYAESEAKIKEAKEKERLKMEQQAVDATACFAVLVGQMQFPSQADWAHGVDCFCKRIEEILPKIGIESLNDVELFFLAYYLRMLNDSKTKYLTSLRNYLYGSYAQIRQEYFRLMLQGTGSALNAWTHLF